MRDRVQVASAEGAGPLDVGALLDRERLRPYEPCRPRP